MQTKLTYGAVIPLGIEEAFDFVSDPANWQKFFAGMESAEALEGWGAEGGRARMVTRVLGKAVVTELELTDWDRPHRFRYIGHNEGRRDMVNDRVFEVVPGGTRMTGTTVGHGKPRGGIHGLVDLVMLLGLRRVLRRAMKELPTQASLWARSRAPQGPDGQR